MARLQEGIDVARKTFGAEREGLEDMLTRDFVSGVDAADTLLSLTDEYGLEHAGDLLRERPGDFGELRDRIPGDWEERCAEIIEKASRANQSLDRLDELTHRREALLQREGGRVLNIQGQEFALRGEIPEAVPLDKAQPERELSHDRAPAAREGDRPSGAEPGTDARADAQSIREQLWRKRSAISPLKHPQDSGLQWREMFLHDFPDNLVLNLMIFVAKDVTHACDFRPRNPRFGCR